MDEVGTKEPSMEEISEQPLLVPDTVELVASTKETIIFLHSLSSVSTPQTFKINYYIKYHQLVVLIDSGSNHNFINQSKAQSLPIFIHPVNIF